MRPEEFSSGAGAGAACPPVVSPAHLESDARVEGCVRREADLSRRIDYYDDPAAPKANSLVPSVNVVVTTTPARSC